MGALCRLVELSSRKARALTIPILADNGFRVKPGSRNSTMFRFAKHTLASWQSNFHFLASNCSTGCGKIVFILLRPEYLAACGENEWASWNTSVTNWNAWLRKNESSLRMDDKENNPSVALAKEGDV